MGLAEVARCAFGYDAPTQGNEAASGSYHVDGSAIR
jgi:hypothetical protein